MSQSGPKYPEMATDHPEITSFLKFTYGDNLVWPVLWYYRKNLNIDSVSFEVNNKNNTNSKISSDHSIIQKMIKNHVYYYNFSSTPRYVESLKKSEISDYAEIVVKECESSYEYISNNHLNTKNISTIDIDYLWMNSHQEIIGLEVTTLRVDMKNKKIAVKLLSAIIEKRFSRPGAHHLSLISKAAKEIFGAKLLFVCVNNIKDTSNILPNSNVVWFELDELQASNIHKGIIPDENVINFDSFQNFLKIL